MFKIKDQKHYLKLPQSNWKIISMTLKAKQKINFIYWWESLFSRLIPCFPFSPSIKKQENGNLIEILFYIQFKVY